MNVSPCFPQMYVLRMTQTTSHIRIPGCTLTMIFRVHLLINAVANKVVGKCNLCAADEVYCLKICGSGGRHVIEVYDMANL